MEKQNFLHIPISIQVRDFLIFFLIAASLHIAFSSHKKLAWGC